MCDLKLPNISSKDVEDVSDLSRPISQSASFSTCSVWLYTRPW